MNSSLQHSKVRDVFDDWALRGRAEGMERGHGPAARQAFDRLNLGTAGRYLDVGCGNGYTVRWAAEQMPTGTAVGLDLSANMVERARAASTAFPNARFVNDAFPSAELLKPELRGEGFDGIFSMEVFYYLPDLGEGLSAVRELLAPAGRFVCIVDFYEENPDSHSWPEDLGVGMTLLSEAGWREAFEAAGLEVLEQGRLRSTEGDDWKQEQGSLMTLGRIRG